MEWVRLRVKDVDFSLSEILIRDGKGAKDRVTLLPPALLGPLQAYLQGRRQLYEADLALGRGRATVYLPDALARKYPNAASEAGGAGSMCFRPAAFPAIRSAVWSSGTIGTKRVCNGR